jgi:hypothetical protein
LSEDVDHGREWEEIDNVAITIAIKPERRCFIRLFLSLCPAVTKEWRRIRRAGAR